MPHRLQEERATSGPATSGNAVGPAVTNISAFVDKGNALQT